MGARELSAVFQALEVSEATHHPWRQQYVGMKAEEAKRLKETVTDKELDIRMVMALADGKW